MKTAKYRKWCFDQIQGIFKDNKELTVEVDQLRKLLETTEKDQIEIGRKSSMLSSSLVRKSRKE
jgi:hypothetical protein